MTRSAAPPTATAGALYGRLAVLGSALWRHSYAVGRVLDTHPRRTALTVAITLTGAVTALGVARAGWIVFALVMLWGATAGALPVILQHAVLHTAPDAPDIPSGAYVVSYQLGITGGSALGATLLSHTTGTSPMNGWDEDKVKKVIGIDGRDDLATALLVSVGYPAEERLHPGRRTLEHTVFYERHTAQHSSTHQQ
ncbi:MFS family permease [Nocardia sp. GAS34]|uniref:hypothetical protein n=1 Tax=unclassified Nocardia TaxID=2637762 RepID=UPI003D1EE399